MREESKIFFKPCRIHHISSMVVLVRFTLNVLVSNTNISSRIPCILLYVFVFHIVVQV